jgi:hypothetical protein
MNGLSLLFFIPALALGGCACYALAIFITKGLRRINPAWVGAPVPPLPPAPKMKTRLVSKERAYAFSTDRVFTTQSIVLGNWRGQLIEQKMFHDHKA